ncbi:MAG: hypothetical protein JNL13_12125 [Chitinophagaceae bacterium]|nr:hypothetical protein [Chitinophagaceae bacterium]
MSWILFILHSDSRRRIIGCLAKNQQYLASSPASCQAGNAVQASLHTIEWEHEADTPWLSFQHDGSL